MTRAVDAARAAAARLSAAGVEGARAQADQLTRHALGLRAGPLLLAPELDAAAEQRLQTCVADRLRGVPLQHLLGRAPFRHLDLAVGPGVFIPRPETELIIELAADALGAAQVVYDLCAGSGAIALSVATEYPGRQVSAVERSAAALEWLRRNVAETAPSVRIVAGDVTDPALAAADRGRADVVLSNPPYVPTGRVVAAEVGHDPGEAVFAGPDGLGLMPAVIATAHRLLKPGGLAVIEHDDSHQPEVLALLGSRAWTSARPHADLTGRPRFVSAVRQDGAHE